MGLTIKLNIGCGETKLEGWVNVDLRPEVKPDIVSHAHYLKQYANYSVDEILAAHVLEHISHGISFDHPDRVAHPNVSDTLEEWFRILKGEGRLEVRTPNAVSIVDYMYDETDLRIFNMAILGGQENTEDYHRSAFNWRLLREVLQSVGFVKIRRITDCKEPNGTHPANLVVEAFKP